MVNDVRGALDSAFTKIYADSGRPSIPPTRRRSRPRLFSRRGYWRCRRSSGSIGIGFDIPADTTKMVVAQLKDHGHVTRD
jgi:S1-C subfamily serine protease